VLVGGEWGSFGLITDISREKQMERTIAEREAEYQAIFASTTDALIVVGPDFNIVEANPRACEMYGYEHDDLVGRPARELIHPDHRYLEALTHRRLAEGSIFEGEGRGLRRDGTSMPTEVRCVRFRYRGEDHTLVVVRDITERRQAEQALLRSERLAAVGTLAGGVAHEFNNINVSVLGFTDLALLDETLRPDTRECLERIHRAALRARSVTRNLLAFSGARRQEPEPTDLNRLVQNARELINHDLESDGVAVEEELRPLPPVLVDPAQMEQVFLNLLLNARHAMLDRDDRRLRLASGTDEEHVWVTVADSGCGIEPDALARIFTPFYTTKGEHAQGGTPQSRIRGTGLGLSVSHTIVSNHDGEILVESDLGEGTAFTVRLPRREAPEPPPAPAARGASLASRPGTGRRRLLVVDDEEDVRVLLERHLRAAGYEIRSVPDGDAALQTLREESFDLVLLDLKMPRTDGEAFLERLEELPRERRAPVMVITGKSVEALTPSRRHPLVVRILRKPFELQELEAQIGETLGPGPEADAPDADGAAPPPA
jgi:PAS domain S-box-containing protein